MRILMHACCGPCSIVPVRDLKGSGADLSAYFYNPNIHPFTEWRARRETLEAHMGREGVGIVEAQGYDVAAWLKGAIVAEEGRCAYCWRTRLKSAAEAAAEGGFDAFTTTLLYSRYQDHEMIKRIGDEEANLAGVAFHYSDWRTGWSEGVEESKRLGMYRQKYCGCIFSEEERYLRKGKGAK